MQNENCSNYFSEIQNLCAKIVYLMVRSQIRGVHTIHMHIDFFC